MADRIDLRPLMAHPDAIGMVLLARGQLNRAFRGRGLKSPDPLTLGRGAGIPELTTFDDPAAEGIDAARARFGGAFEAWAAEMPRDLVAPLIEVLRNTHAALRARGEVSGAAAIAVVQACDFLRAGIVPEGTRPGGV